MLDADHKRRLRQRAHALKPVVLVGQHGVTDAVAAEADGALSAHELIKIRFRGVEREARGEQMQALAARLGAELVTAVGATGVFFRANPEPRKKRSRP